MSQLPGTQAVFQFIADDVLPLFCIDVGIILASSNNIEIHLLPMNLSTLILTKLGWPSL